MRAFKVGDVRPVVLAASAAGRSGNEFLAAAPEDFMQISGFISISAVGLAKIAQNADLVRSLPMLLLRGENDGAAYDDDHKTTLEALNIEWDSTPADFLHQTSPKNPRAAYRRIKGGGHAPYVQKEDAR